MRKSLSFSILVIMIVLVTYTVQLELIVPVNALESKWKIIQSYWGDGAPLEVSPGDTAPFTVLLIYKATPLGAEYTFKTIQASLTLPTPFEGVGGDNPIQLVYTGTITDYSVIKLQFPIYLQSNTQLGNYTAQLTLISYYYYYSSTTTKTATSNTPVYGSFSQQLTVMLEVMGRPDIEVTIPNISNIYEGKQQVLVVISNSGTATAKNIKIENIQSNTGVTTQLENQIVGDLEPDANITLPLSLFIPTGYYYSSLTFELTYLGPENVAYDSLKTLQLIVNTAELASPIGISLSLKELKIGESNKLSWYLTNNGNSSLSGVQLAQSSDSTLKIIGNTIFYIGILAPKESRQIETEVYVPLSTVNPTGSVTLSTKYFDEARSLSVSITQQYNLFLRGVIKIFLTDFEVVPEIPSPGSFCYLIITIVNRGTITASAVEVTPSLDGLPVKSFGQITNYIGNIETNLPTTFTLNLQIMATNCTNITLPISLTYMDNLRSWYNVTFGIPLAIS